MSLDERLLELLRCPRCKGELEYRTAGKGGEAPPSVEGGPESEALLCHGCRLRYAVRDGIPIMLVEEAESF